MREGHGVLGCIEGLRMHIVLDIGNEISPGLRAQSSLLFTPLVAYRPGIETIVYRSLISCLKSYDDMEPS